MSAAKPKLAPVAPEATWADRPVQALTLVEVLQLLRGIDEGVIDASKERWAEVSDALRAKVDEHVAQVEELKARATAIRNLVAPHLEKAGEIDALAHKLEADVFEEVRASQLTRLPGMAFRLAVKESWRCSPVRPTPTEQDALEYGPFVRLKFEWDKTALTKALKAEDAQARELARFEGNKTYGWEANT